MDISIEEILEVNKQPETFVCDVCGTTKHQDQTTTQRKGWPICHQMTMKGHNRTADDEGPGSQDTE